MIAWTIPDGTSQATMENANYPDFVKLSTSKSSSNTSKAMLVPSKLITFIEDQHGEQFAIVHSCCQYQKKMSVLTYRWQLEYTNIKENRQVNAQYDEEYVKSKNIPVYHKVSIASIQKHCLVIPYEENSPFVMEIIDQDLWANAFSEV